MILNHYGLREQPFGTTPDPQFLYASKMHREALASLLYAIESGRGFTALIAPPGLGKTTLLFHLLGSFRGKAKTAFVFQTQCKPRELLRFLLKEFGITSPTADFVAMHHALNDMLATESMAGRKCVIVLDEAHNLSDSVLESVRLLSDFETPNRKLLHIVMAGQSELKERLAEPSLAQLRQRIGVICKLAPLPAKEVDEYIQHRLKVAGYSGPPLFTPAAMAIIREFSQGVPRKINALCFSAMSLAFALGKTELDAQILEEAVADLSLEPLDTLPLEDKPETNDLARPPTPETILSGMTRSPESAQPELAPFNGDVSTLSAAARAEAQTVVQANANDPVEIPGFREVNLEQEANIPTTQAARQAETKIPAEPFSDPLQNIDLSSYALLDGLPSKKSPPRVEESYIDQGNPWKSPTAPAPEPEFDVLKQRLANQTYPMRGARGEMRRDLVIVGLITAILGAAVLAALLWLRPNVGFAMGRPQPEPAITTSSRAIAPAKVEIPKPKQAARRTLPMITSAGLTPVATKRQFFPASVEEAAPPELPLDDSIRLQQLQAVMASTSSQPHLKDPSSAENFLEPENEINTPLEMTSPVYPESAKQAKLEGTVVLNIVVDKDGKVKRLDPISGDQQLADAAIKAVSKWRYRPSLVNGKRVESFKQVEMTFKLGERSADSSPQQATQ